MFYFVCLLHPTQFPQFLFSTALILIASFYPYCNMSFPGCLLTKLVMVNPIRIQTRLIVLVYLGLLHTRAQFISLRSILRFEWPRAPNEDWVLHNNLQVPTMSGRPIYGYTFWLHGQGVGSGAIETLNLTLNPTPKSNFIFSKWHKWKIHCKEGKNTRHCGERPRHPTKPLANETPMGIIKKPPNMLPISLANNLLPEPNFVKRTQILVLSIQRFSSSSKDIPPTVLYYSLVNFSKWRSGLFEGAIFGH
jgi:hypothetical protein